MSRERGLLEKMAAYRSTGLAKAGAAIGTVPTAIQQCEFGAEGRLPGEAMSTRPAAVPGQHDLVADRESLYRRSDMLDHPTALVS
jgi:hypothetical protein